MAATSGRHALINSPSESNSQAKLMNEHQIAVHVLAQSPKTANNRKYFLKIFQIYEYDTMNRRNYFIR